ncbi:MAG: radical SAM protein [Chloroflexi bacterium]|nr:radical SAM protein [Chloroflexota bacterium]MBV9600453.1 radical SAM protein [Chloroflexota bacterium]
MPRPEYVEITCKSAVHRVQGMPYLKWSLNPYGGCVHRCRFCFAVQYRVLAEEGTQQDFGTRLFIKTNFVDVLARELRRPGLQGEHLTLGTATDPYQPVEGRYRLTRGALALMCEHANPMSMLTKSPLVVRDVDLLADLAHIASAEVFFSITTVDLDLWRTVEPGTANPFNRLRAMRTLREAGVTAGVMMAPILPGLTDSVDSIAAVAAAAREHAAAHFSTAPLRLAPHVKEFYLGFIGDEYPDLLPRYQRAYPGAYAPLDYREKLQERINRIRAEYGFTGHLERRPRPTQPAPLPRRGPQLVLPL